MRNFKKFIYIFALTLLAIGCAKEEIDPSIFNIAHEDTYDIVIEGFISTEKTRYKVLLSKPISFSNSDIVHISNAKVKIIDGNNTYDFEPTSVAGEYLSIDSISGEVGKKYTLIVEYNNKTYTASDTLVECNPIFDYPLKDLWITSDNFYQYEMDIHNFGFDYPSIWITGGYSVDSPEEGNRPISFDIADRFLKTINFYNHVGSRPQGIFASTRYLSGISAFPTDSIELIKLSVSDDYYEYIVSELNISIWSSGIFSTIPGNSKSNVSEGGTGFFYCTDVIRYRTTFGDLKKYVPHIYSQP